MNISLHLRYAARHWAKETPAVESRARWLRSRERLPWESLRKEQERLLGRTLECAAARIPAYRHLSGRVPHDRPAALLRELPVIDKQVLLAERARHYPGAGRSRWWYSVGKTSGTTGTPLEVFRTYNSTLWEQACCRQHWDWAGWRRGERQVVLRGDMVVPVERDQPPYWFEDRFGRQLIVSTRHLSKRNIEAIVEAIQAYGAAQLRAYPSAAYTLATLVGEAGASLRFRSVITSSEILLPVQRQRIESTFGARVFDHYGMAERVAFGMECEHGRLHVHPEYSFVEILDDAGQPTDGVGYVVGTTLRNSAMPLIRYRLSDQAQWGRGTCPCGRSYPFFESVGGKYEDQLFDVEGEPVSPSVVTFAFKGVSHIAKAQVAQIARDRWAIRVVPSPQFGEGERDRLLNNFRTLVSNRVTTQVELLDDIPLQASGKYKWVSQEFYRAGSPQRSAG
jgi:phenylacetate-CoA ligase